MSVTMLLTPFVRNEFIHRDRSAIDNQAAGAASPR